MPISSNTGIDNIDVYLHYTKDGKEMTGKIESMEFYWYPWTLAETYLLSKDASISPSDQAQAGSIFTHLASRHEEAIKQATACCTFQLGEYLYCLGSTFRAPPPQ